MKVFLLKADNLKNKKPKGPNSMFRSPDNICVLKNNSNHYSRVINNQDLKSNSITESEYYNVQLFQEDSKLLVLFSIKVAESFFSKLTGLIFKKNLNSGEGLLVENCNSIHTFWMRFPIDVLFLDANNRVIYIVKDLKPFRVTPLIRGAIKVLEIKSGEVSRLGLNVGNILRFK